MSGPILRRSPARTCGGLPPRNKSKRLCTITVGGECLVHRLEVVGVPNVVALWVVVHIGRRPKKITTRDGCNQDYSSVLYRFVVSLWWVFRFLHRWPALLATDQHPNNIG